MSLHHYVGSRRVEGLNPDMEGNCSRLRGDCTNLRGEIDGAMRLLLKAREVSE